MQCVISIDKRNSLLIVGISVGFRATNRRLIARLVCRGVTTHARIVVSVNLPTRWIGVSDFDTLHTNPVSGLADLLWTHMLLVDMHTCFGHVVLPLWIGTWHSASMSYTIHVTGYTKSCFVMWFLYGPFEVALLSSSIIRISHWTNVSNWIMFCVKSIMYLNILSILLGWCYMYERKFSFGLSLMCIIVECGWSRCGIGQLSKACYHSLSAATWSFQLAR